MWWLVLIAFRVSVAQFIYTVDYEACNMCIRSECVALGGSKCRYYAETAGMLEENVTTGGDDEEFRDTVDSLIYDLVESAGHYETCIPYMSKYTDCSKDSICTGCNICKCDDLGRWRCSIIQQCQPDDEMVDGRKLRNVIDHLKTQNSKDNPQYIKRRKRSAPSTDFGISKSVFNLTDSTTCIVKLHNIMSTLSTTPKIISRSHNTSVTVKIRNATAVEYTPSRNAKDTDNLSFEDVLNEIKKDKEISLKKKHSTKGFRNLMVPEKGNISNYNLTSAEEFVDMLNALEELETTGPSTATEVVIDLLKSAKQYYEIDNDNTKVDTNKFDSTSVAIDNEIGNVIKREVSTKENATYVPAHNETALNFKDLEENVLKPLSNMIDTKQQELDELINIKTKLLSILQNYYNINSSAPFTNRTQNQDEYFSIYKLELVPTSDTLRRNDPQILEKYLLKLKRDIYEVIRDIVGIRKVSKSKLTRNIKVLARAMKHYVHKEGGIHKTNNDSKITRRVNKKVAYSVKDHVVTILETVYNEIAVTNKEISLSLNAKRIMRRLVKENCDEFDVIGLKVLKNHSNLTKYLEEIGTEWRDKLYDVINSPPLDKIYNVKLLHLQLMNDIVKMQDALELIQFAHARRMVIIDDVSSEIRAIRKIYNVLKTVDNDVKQLVNKTKKPNLIIVKKAQEKPPRKHSFLKHVKNLLKNTKIDILKLFHKKVPHANIIKEAAKNHLDNVNEKRLNEYENTFKGRSKRALYSINKHKRSRFNNILPKYLRGKVFPTSKTIKI